MHPLQRHSAALAAFLGGLWLLSQAALGAPAWPDTRLARTQALALLETLNSDLLSHDSATLTLDRWCAGHKLAANPTVVAVRIAGQDKPATADIRKSLRVGAGEPIAYRHVRLTCGTRILSEADNWYVPARLTPAMNAALDTSDIAFGRAVRDLHFRRQTLSADLLWQPLAPGWEMGAPSPATKEKNLRIPARVLRHRAVLTLPDGTPISAVVETYTGEVLDFPPPE